MERRSALLPALLAGSALLALIPFAPRIALLAGAQDASRIVNLLYDDVYYYLNIAANIADSGRSSFDTVTLTNGYQPLWLGVLALLATLLGTEPLRLFIGACALAYLVVIGPLLYGVVRCRRAAIEDVALWFGVALGVVHSHELIFMHGMETTLFLPLSVPLILAIENVDEPQSLRRLGALLVIALMIRLDSAAMLAALLAVRMVETALRREAWIASLRVAWVALPVLAALAIYMLVNYAYFGTPVPVSGLAKAADGPTGHNWGIYPIYTFSLRRVVPLLAVCAFLEFRCKSHGGAGALFYRAAAVLLLTSWLQYLYYAVFSTWPVWPWYEYAGTLATVAVFARIALLLEVCARSRQGWVAAWVVCALAAVSVRATIAMSATQAIVGWRNLQPVSVSAGDPGLLLGGPRSYNQTSLIMLARLFPAGTHHVVAMGDRAGGLAYWGRKLLNVVQTEGIVSDLEYLRARKQRRGAEYLERKFAIDYFITDRTFIPTLTDAAGARTYVVADPIQSRVADQPVPTFCFPERALKFAMRYKLRGYDSDRLAFAFDQRKACGARDLELIEAAIRGQGLRQLSLPEEYKADPAMKRAEDRDRRSAGRTP